MIDWTTLRIDLDKPCARFLYDILDAGLRLEVEEETVDKYPEGVGPFGCYDMCGNVGEWIDDVQDDGMHIFTFVRGGSYHKAPHYWHAEGGPQPTYFHLKFQLLNEGMNRCGTVGFRCVEDVEDDTE